MSIVDSTSAPTPAPQAQLPFLLLRRTFIIIDDNFELDNKRNNYSNSNSSNNNICPVHRSVSDLCAN